MEQLGNAQTAERHISQGTHERLYLLLQRPMLRQEIRKMLSGALIGLEQWKKHEVLIMTRLQTRPAGATSPLHGLSKTSRMTSRREFA